MRACILSILVLVATAGLRVATTAADEFDNRVDLELVLAVDISRSMDLAEQIVQRRGYAEAFRSDDVISAIAGGMWGRIAVAYVEWSGANFVRVVVPWTIVGDHATALAFADALEAQQPKRLSRTSISSAIQFGRSLFGTGGWQGLRRVIDVSGDGPNNHGLPVKPVSDAISAEGITINGLPLMMRSSTYGFGIENLDEYYYDCVIGGPGSFVLPAYSWEEFPEAVRRKLVLEISDVPDGGLLHRAASGSMEDQTREKVDCMIGEKLWQMRMQDLEWR